MNNISADHPAQAEPLDHRDLNRHLGYFASDPLAGAGLPLWLPPGSAVRHELERLAKDLARQDGCIDVHSPVLGKRALYERSGHLAKFADDMFPSMRLGDASAADELMLRPANCPHHALIFAASSHSYRELPVRYNELASMFRAERSGNLSGLSRVRQISLDDSHVFCRPDQVGQEAARGLRSALEAQRILGLPVEYVRLSKRDSSPNWLGSNEQWEQAEAALRASGAPIIAAYGLELVEAPGEAAFYGPKFDLQVKNGRGHEESIATVQLDFNQPERFDLSYVGPDNRRERVAMIHRGAVGSMERVVASLMEQYQGKLPFWLSPVQMVVLPLNDAHDGQANSLLQRARAAGLRVEADFEGSLGSRIKAARHRKVNLVAVIGDHEVAAKVVQANDLRQGVRFMVSAEDLVRRMQDAHRHRASYVAAADGL